MGKSIQKIKVWTNTHWLIREDFPLQPNLWSLKQHREDGRGLFNAQPETVLSVISEPIDPIDIKYDKGDQRVANHPFVEVLYLGQIWYTYCHRIFHGCKRL